MDSVTMGGFPVCVVKGKALDVYSRLPTDDAQDYDLLKTALLKRFNLTEEGFKNKFKSTKPDESEPPTQFITRLEDYFHKWVELSGATRTYKGLANLMVREQYLETCSKELAVFLKERGVMDLSQLAKLAEQYTDAHNDRTKNTRAAAMRGYNDDNAPDASNDDGWRRKIRCYNCGSIGHMARNCGMPKKADNFSNNDTTQYSRGYHFRSGRGRGSVRGNNAQSRQEDMKLTQSDGVCRAHNQERCIQCNTYPDNILKCNAMHTTEVQLKCGCVLPVIADACRTSTPDNMPVTHGRIGDKRVSVLRDTGCSTVVIRRELVSTEQLTGAHTACVLIDGTIRRCPLAEVKIETPHYSGTVTAVCMRNPLYDVILGNIPGVKETTTYTRTELGAVVTRAEEDRRKTQTPLKVLKEQDVTITKEELRKMQTSDETLKLCWTKAEGKDVSSVGSRNDDTHYFVKDGLLYRKTVTKAQDKIQLLVPARLRQNVLAVAHDSILGGHRGIKRTYLRVLESFAWPGQQGDVTRYCRSCGICQRTVAKGKVANIHLGHMPIIDVPFERVAVDLIGPITPPTEKGHRYIVTLVDYATRYPEAAPLKDITAETVAEALVTIFSRVGVPREILSDQGSQFISGVMKETSRLLSLKQLVTTPYHPMCNGLVERFNGTLKNMLKKMCSERPIDWDRYIAPLLFAYRDVPQESLGFSPFQLLYGRAVRGPMTILQELWTKEIPEPEVKLTYQYVLDLQDRLQETCKLARDELLKAQFKQRRQYNKNAKWRAFKKGDKVLLLLPNNLNKLLMQWQGPYSVIERINSYDYMIQLPGRTRMFHANMLKKYYGRETDNIAEDLTIANAAVLTTESGDDDEYNLSLYTDMQTENYEQVDINPDLSIEHQNQLRDLVHEFRDVFSDVPKVTNLGTHEIKLTSNEPIHGKPYPVPFAMRDVVEKEIETMLKLGIIEPSTASYASPVVVVRKPDGSSRICIDFRKLNKVTVFDPEPMTQADEIFAKLVESSFFSKFDLSKGYWQVAMKEEDKDFTTFVTQSGLYRFRVMPFGLVNAPATFNRVMRRLLRDLRNLENYLDDVLAHSATWDQHLVAVQDFLTRVRMANLSLRPSKCSLGYTTISFLGHTVGKRTISPNLKTVQKIKDATPPKTKKQLQSFLGLAGYYRRFVPNFAAVAVPLTDLTKKGSPNIIPWDEPQERAFIALKAYISNEPILRLPDFSKMFIIQTDASNEGIGAILLQEDGEIKHPIAFASRKLLPREKNYSTIERECLAIVWGIQKFEMYLYGKTFLLETDHQPLQYLESSRFQNGRLMRWALALQPYSFNLRAIKGCENVGADFLSRSVE